MDNYLKTAIVLSAIILLASLLGGGSLVLLWLTGLLILANTGLSLSFLFRHSRISKEVIVLNTIQLALFSLLHYLVFAVLGPHHYAYAAPPSWYDWLELVLVHALRAIDIFDLLEAYGIEVHLLWPRSFFAGTMLVLMHIAVDIFLIGAILGALHRRAPNRKPLFEGTILSSWLIKARVAGLAGSLLLFFFIFTGRAMKNVFRADPSNLFTWPLDNILRIIDIGDAFQIFDWQLHNLETSPGLATVSILFRATLGFYFLELINILYLRIMGGKGKTLEELGVVYTSDDFDTKDRILAARRLFELGVDAAPALPLLATAFEEKHSEIRKAGIQAVVQIGRQAIFQLVPLLANENPHVNKEIREALFDIDPHWIQSPEALQASQYLVPCLLDSNFQVRHRAREALDSIDPDWHKSENVQENLPFLVESLKHPDFNKRAAAANVLGKIGPPADVAVFRLAKALVDENGHVRVAAKEALNQIDCNWPRSQRAQNALTHIVAGLSDADREIRETSIEALRTMGASSAGALIAAVQGENRHVAAAAADALGQIGPVVLPDLAKAMKTSDPDSKQLLRAVLAKLKPVSPRSRKSPLQTAGNKTSGT